MDFRVGKFYASKRDDNDNKIGFYLEFPPSIEPFEVGSIVWVFYFDNPAIGSELFARIYKETRSNLEEFGIFRKLQVVEIEGNLVGFIRIEE